MERQKHISTVGEMYDLVIRAYHEALTSGLATEEEKRILQEGINGLICLRCFANGEYKIPTLDTPLNSKASHGFGKIRNACEAMGKAEAVYKSIMQRCQ